MYYTLSQSLLVSGLKKMRGHFANVSRIVLILDPGLTFHREIIAGVGAFSQAAGLKWVFEVESNILKVLSAPKAPDGFIADASAMAEVELLASMDKYPLVCVSSAVTTHCPEGVPQVASDNHALIDAAIQHLRDAGITGFAFYAKPKYQEALWAVERREAFQRQIARPAGVLYDAEGADDGRLAAWLQALPPRTGIVAVNDSSARAILHTCNAAGRNVPDDIAIVGIDNDPLVASLAPLPISSVIQGSYEIGRKAAELLHMRMRDKGMGAERLSIPPKGVHPAASSPKTCPVLRDALEYIGHHAIQGIKAEQVADHLGMSRTTLERLFREHLGYTAHDELLRTRMEQAKQLLLSRTLSTAEVARRCGFRTQQYMHVVFKRELGLSPSEFVDKSVGNTTHSQK
jgi:LacI family transcriptional regulator